MYLDRDSAVELFDIEDLVIMAYELGASTEQEIRDYVNQFMNASADEVRNIIINIFEEVTVN